jgi:hypothetical protein
MSVQRAFPSLTLVNLSFSKYSLSKMIGQSTKNDRLGYQNPENRGNTAFIFAKTGLPGEK